MKKIVLAILKGTGVLATMLMAYNAFIFVEVAVGRHQEYIWWLHFPLRLLRLVG